MVWGEGDWGDDMVWGKNLKVERGGDNWRCG